MTKIPNYKHKQLYRNVTEPAQSVSVIDILNLRFICDLVLALRRAQGGEPVEPLFGIYITDAS